jgi:tRNA(Ile)-lysidine synthase
VDASILNRFRGDFDAVVAQHARIGIAVSGGPDSLALLLLAAAVRPGQVEAATIDHGLRPEAADEAAMVATVCDRLGVRHATLTARWSEVPETAIQERARNKRYRLLGYWAEERGLEALVTAHHAEDQAETLLMRLARGSGVRGLAGMRPRSVSPGVHIRLVRPLLGWRRAELEQVCLAAGVEPVADPSNQDERFERVRVRRALAALDWLDAGAVAHSAAILADADAALDWAARFEWDQRVQERRGSIIYRPSDAPAEIVRRVVGRAIRKLATEGEFEPRGTELSRLVSTLSDGGTGTLRGVLCRGGAEWHFVPSSNRTRPVDNFE